MPVCLSVQDPATGRARYGFLEFERMESAQEALDAWNGKPLDDAPCMNLGFAKPKNAPGAAGGCGDANQPARLFVANIGSGTTAGTHCNTHTARCASGSWFSNNKMELQLNCRFFFFCSGFAESFSPLLRASSL